MQKLCKLVLDTACEVHDLLKPWADAEFQNFAQHVVVPNAVYVIGREEFTQNASQIIALVNSNTIKVVFSNPAEGSDTQINHFRKAGITELVREKRILAITGGDVPSDFATIFYENFLTKVLDYEENLLAAKQYQAQYCTDRPYMFLFLNGRCRRHRQQLLYKLQPLLGNALWTNLDLGNGPLKLLPEHYEVDRFNKNISIKNVSFVKTLLFGEENGWGDVYIRAEPYNDTYFSVVTETVFDYPYSFRTEKIWKPIVVGHPWIAVANRGFYRDMHNLGFRSFGHLIDESFDLIDNNQDRLARIAEVIEDLCQQDLAKFLEQCYNTCKYNQEHLAAMQLKVRADFPERFFKFVNAHY